MDYNTVLNLNSVIYQIYNTKDFNYMKKAVLSSLRTLIPCVCASIIMNYDEQETIFSDPTVVPDNYLELEERYINIQQKDGSLWVLHKTQSMVFKDTELMPDEERVKSEYYQACLAPFGLHYSVDITITDGRKMMGIMSLYRTKAQGDFTNEEVSILRLLSDHFNARFAARNDASQSVDSENMDPYIAQYDLTSREAEILKLIFIGYDNEAISAELCISPYTLKKHLQNLYRKTDVSGRVQLKALK